MQQLRSQNVEVCFFTQGDKPGKFLARALNKQYGSSHIPKIMSRSGQVVTKTSDIQEVFRLFFEDLYNLKDNGTGDQHVKLCQDYIKSSGKLKLDCEEALLLERPISLEEVQTSIRNTKSGKAPGPDGFIVAFYKRFVEIRRQWNERKNR